MPDRPTGPEKPGLPELRRFRFTDSEVPGPTRPPVPPPPAPPSSADAPAAVDAEVSDTFDESDLDYDDTPHPGPSWVDEPARTAPAFLQAPATPPPSRPGPPTPPPGWAPAPRTGGVPVGPSAPPPAAPPPAARRRRTPLILAGVAVVVLAVLVFVLIVGPFSGTDNTAQAPGDAAPTQSETGAGSAPDASSAPQSGEPSRGGAAPTVPGPPLGTATWAQSVCGSLTAFEAAAEQLRGKLTTTTVITETAVVNAAQPDAADLLASLTSQLDTVSGATDTDAAAALIDALASDAEQAAYDVDPEQGGTAVQQDQRKELILASLDVPVKSFNGLLKTSGSQVSDDVDAEPSCEPLLRDG